jgi:restriction system protein
MIPDFQSIMLPLMSLAGDELEHTSREAIEKLATYFKLSDLDRQELLPSGTQAIFDNRVGWAKTHLKKAGLLESPKRSVFKITERGKAVLVQKPSSINMPFLRQYPEYIEFTRATSNNGSSQSENIVSEEILKNTPEETLEYAYQKIRQTLAQDILTKVKTVSPAFFEKLVVELLVKMGYGGSIKDAGKAIGKSGDEGIDGIIKEDKLGLDVIYIQAKRWEGVVGRPELHKFVGALAGQGAKKGIFISTSYFTKDAKEYTPKNETKIVLIDGEQLAQFMIDYNLGVSRQNFYEIKKIDSDYFGDE